MKRALSLLLATVTSLALAACSSRQTPSGQPATSGPAGTVTSASSSAVPTTAASPSTSATTSPTKAPPRASSAPAHYTTRRIYRGSAHPDDLVLDPQGVLHFSDYTNGTISRLNADGTTTVLHRGLAGPEGMVFLADGTLVVATEKTNQILTFGPGSSTPHLIRTLPGTPALVECHQGVDGIAWDGATQTVILPDAVTGTIYSMSPDGSRLSTIATGFVHPVGAGVDSHGTVYVADECGGNVWRIGANGTRTNVAPAVMPDDVSPDGYGNLVVTDVRHTQHAVTRTNLVTGATTTLARAGLIEPQGLVIDAAGRIYVSDDLADVILELTPR